MTRVLFDENIPRELRRELSDFEIRTVQEQGWSGLKNGELLRVAQEEFAVFVTADKRLQHQKNPASFNIGIVVAAARSTRLVHMRALTDRIKDAIGDTKPGTVTVVAGQRIEHYRKERAAALRRRPALQVSNYAFLSAFFSHFFSHVFAQLSLSHLSF